MDPQHEFQILFEWLAASLPGKVNFLKRGRIWLALILKCLANVFKLLRKSSEEK